MPKDWKEWHRAYDDPKSALSQRLQVVQHGIARALDDAAPGPLRVLSLCAGDSRDLFGVARTHRRACDLVGAIVEHDPTLAALATAERDALGLSIEVVCADAGHTANYRNVGGVDLLLLCGIFGNLCDSDVETTINMVPQLVRPDATIIWTRHRRPPDLTPSIRAWFDGVHCREIAFVSPDTSSSETTPYAVGTERFEGTPRARHDHRIFSLVS